MNKNNLAENLYTLRRNAALSQEEFAEKLGVSRQAVSKWERGEAYPDTDNLITISQMFGITIDDLLNSNEIIDNASNEEQTDNGCILDTSKPDETNKSCSDDSADEASQSDNDASHKIHIKAGHLRVAVGEDDEDMARKKSKLSLWYTLPYPIFALIAFLALGMLGGWDWSWTLFITIPIYYSILDCIRKRSFSEFVYPVFMAFLYCLFGMLFSWWHPGWLIFITIPLYYPIAHFIDSRIHKNDNNQI